MTMQVGLVAEDGVLLASDTKWVEEDYGLTRAYHASKIKISADGAVAIAHARKMIPSGEIADRIIRELTDDDWKLQPVASIQRITQDVIGKTNPRQDAHCLIVRTRPALCLFSLKTREMPGETGWYPVCQRMEMYEVSGHDTNLARYWLERHYYRHAMQKLALLAATTITAAAKFNSAMIGGLEMVACDSTGCRRLSPEWTRELAAKAETVHASVIELLNSCPKQFDYAPHVIG